MIENNIYKPFSQLCWDCKRTLDCSCEWASRLAPVDGWDAIKDTTENKSTFMIFRCPKFISINGPNLKECLNCKTSFLSYADNVFCSADCYSQYTPVLKECKCPKCGDLFYIQQSSERRYCTKCTAKSRRIPERIQY